jgi:hypothetical protein
MDRRELLKMVAVLTGTAVIGGEFFLSGCTSADQKSTLGFTTKRIGLLDEIGETILPQTATPGAKAAQVGEFMKMYVSDCYSPAAQDAFNKGIDTFEQECKKDNGKSFMDCSPEQRKALLSRLDTESRVYNSKLDESEKPARESAQKLDKMYDYVAAPRHYYTMLKQMTLVGFFTSKVGATQALRNVPVPGRYDGNMPYKKGDKAFNS